MTKISYGGKQLSLGGDGFGSAVFDSGSSYTYFTKEAYNDLVASVSIIFNYERIVSLSFWKFLYLSFFFMQFQDISAKGLFLDASDHTFPICWKAKFPIRYKVMNFVKLDS